MKKEDDEKPLSRREFKIIQDAHSREHALHEKAHELEHEMSSEALHKADTTLERRLEGMNEFRAQLEKQSSDFLTREIFEQYTKEQTLKVETALDASTDKYDTIIKAIVNRHDSDTDASRDSHDNDIQALRNEIQQEREHRKTFEGSINTWKWIATFLGASGVAGVILLFASQRAV